MPIVAALPAILTTAGTLYASSQANGAARDAAQAQQVSQQQALDLQKQQYQQTQQNLQPYMQAGTSGLQNLDSLLAQYIPGYRPMYAQQSGPDWNAYLQANPDAAAWVQVKAQQPDGQGKSVEQLAQWHYQLDGSRREVPQFAAPQATAPANDIGTRPTAGVEPTAMDFGVGMGPPSALSYLQGYKESEGYRVKQKGVTRDVNSGYAAKGLLRSGGAINALAQKTEDLLAEDENQWKQQQLAAFNADLAGYAARQKNYQTALGQYNQNRNVLNDIYNTDRSYNTGNLFNLINIGQNSAAGVGAAGQTYANNSGNILQNMGQTQANYANTVAGNNISTAGQLTGTFGNLLSNWGNRGANWNVSPIDPIGYGSSAINAAPLPGYVSNFTPTPNFSGLFA